MLPHPESALWDSSQVPLQWQSSVSGLQIIVCPLSPAVCHSPVKKDLGSFFKITQAMKQLRFRSLEVRGLYRSLKIQCEWMWNGVDGIGQGQLFRLYEHGNKPSVYIKDRKFIDELRMLGFSAL